MYYFFIDGSRTSRKLSPIRLNPITVLAIAIPGIIDNHGAVRIKSFPPLIMIPQLGVGGWAPRPRKERLASTIIAPAIPNV